MSKNNPAVCGEQGLFAAFDLGIETGGLVALRSDFEGERVVFARELCISKRDKRELATSAPLLSESDQKWINRKALEADMLACEWAQRALAAFDELVASAAVPELVAYETFVDQGARKRYVSRWKTPLALGYLLAGMRERGWSVESGRLIPQWAIGSAYAYERGEVRPRSEEDRLIPGDHLIHGDHLADALVHALALAELAAQRRRASEPAQPEQRKTDPAVANDIEQARCAQ